MDDIGLAHLAGMMFSSYFTGLESMCLGTWFEIIHQLFRNLYFLDYILALLGKCILPLIPKYLWDC